MFETCSTIEEFLNRFWIIYFFEEKGFESVTVVSLYEGVQTGKQDLLILGFGFKYNYLHVIKHICNFILSI